MHRTPAVVVLVSLMIAGAAWSGTTVTYDPGLGSLPEAQGYTYNNLAPGAPAPTVVSGVLLQGPVPIAEQQFWIRHDSSFLFTNGFSIEANLRVVQSGYAIVPGDGSQRSGFYVEAIDAVGRRMTMGVATAGVTVNTDRKLMPGNGIMLLGVPTDDAFHNYRLRTTPDSLFLFIDGIRRGAAVLGDTLFGTSEQTVYFGDGTTAAGSQMKIGVIRYSYPVSTTGVAESAGASGGSLRIVALGSVAHDGVDLEILAGSPDRLRIRVLDLAGRTVRDLGDAIVGHGARSAHWDGKGDAGRAAPAGVYFAVASGQGQRADCRFILLR